MTGFVEWLPALGFFAAGILFLTIGAEGLVRAAQTIAIRLAPGGKKPPPPKGKKPAPAAPQRSYTVRLHFAELEPVKAGGRVFSVALQGKEVLKDFDVARAAGAVRKAVVREFKGVRAGEMLTVTLTAKKGRAVVSAVEVVAA